jgi:hypothetical protein
MNEDMAFLLKFLNNGMRVLSTRLLLVVTLFMAFGLFVWCMIQPDYWRIGAATIFTLLVFLPILGIDKKEKQNVQT